MGYLDKLDDLKEIMRRRLGKGIGGRIHKYGNLENYPYPIEVMHDHNAWPIPKGMRQRSKRKDLDILSLQLLRLKLQDLSKSMIRDIIRDVIASTFTVLIEYLTNPTPEKFKEVKDTLKFKLELSAKIRDAYIKKHESIDPVDAETLILSRVIVCTFHEMFKELETNPEKLYNPEFKKVYLNKLDKIIKTCESMYKMYGSQFRFYKALLTSLSVLIEKAKP